MKGSDDLSSFSAMRSESDLLGESDECDAVLKVINNILMEEELDSQANVSQDALALQSLQKSFYDALGQDSPSSPAYEPPFDSDPDVTNTVSTSITSQSTTVLNSDDGFDCGNGNPIHTLCSQSDFRSPSDGHDTFVNPSDSSVNILPVSCLLSSCDASVNESSRGLEEASQTLTSRNLPADRNDETLNAIETVEKDGSRDMKNREREDIDSVQEERSSKYSAVHLVETELSDMFDKVLLGDGGFSEEDGARKKMKQRGNKSMSKESKLRNNYEEERVDSTTLLTQCAQAVASFDEMTAYELLQLIRKRSSPFGDPSQRVVHYFANGLEARLAGNKGQRCAGLTYIHNGTSASDILKAYQAYISTCPFMTASVLFTNRTIERVSSEKTSLHIIDFGVMYGFQWPSIFQSLSQRPGGPPKVRFTGIEVPSTGFRPSKGVGDTGRRLASYCQRFGIPFEYFPIAKDWETIRLQDLSIVENECIVVNCFCRLGYLLDESVVANNPRGAVLDLIRSINPNVFIHAVANGNYSGPYFVGRFHEALLHFSAVFDMLEATLPREDETRMLFETAIYGSDAMNVIACEGTERFERPETYRQWHARHQRAGFRRMPINRVLVNEIRARVKLNYHKEFIVDEDKHWMLLGWKGRTMYALSCWKPA